MEVRGKLEKMERDVLVLFVKILIYMLSKSSVKKAKS